MLLDLECRNSRVDRDSGKDKQAINKDSAVKTITIALGYGQRSRVLQNSDHATLVKGR